MAYLDLTGDVVEEFHAITDVMLDWDYNDRPDYIHHNNGFINMVWREGDDLWNMHNQVGLDAPDAELRARPADEGLLLTWREAGELAGDAWTLQRDGGELVELAGETDYAYLDRNVDPGVTYSYTLTATKPDGEARTAQPRRWPSPTPAPPVTASPWTTPCPRAAPPPRSASTTSLAAASPPRTSIPPPAAIR